MATNFSRQICEIGETPSLLLGTRIPQGMVGWQSGWTHWHPWCRLYIA